MSMLTPLLFIALNSAAIDAPKIVAAAASKDKKWRSIIGLVSSRLLLSDDGSQLFVLSGPTSRLRFEKGIWKEGETLLLETSTQRVLTQSQAFKREGDLRVASPHAVGAPSTDVALVWGKAQVGNPFLALVRFAKRVDRPMTTCPYRGSFSRLDG